MSDQIMKQENINIGKTREQLVKKIQIQSAKNNFEIKRKEAYEHLDEMIDGYLDAKIKNGEEHFITKFKFTMIELYTQMLDMVELVNTIEVSLSDFNILTNLLDDSMNLVGTGLEINKKYNMWTRFKLNRKFRRVAKNNVNRMNSICDSMKQMMKVASSTQKVMGKVTKKVGKASGIMGGEGSSGNSKVLGIINNRISQRNQEDNENPPIQILPESVSQNSKNSKTDGSPDISGL